MPPDSKETEPGYSDQEASPSADKNTGVVLVPYSCMEVHPYSSVGTNSNILRTANRFIFTTILYYVYTTDFITSIMTEITCLCGLGKMMA